MVVGNSGGYTFTYDGGRMATQITPSGLRSRTMPGLHRAGARYLRGVVWLTQDPLGLGPDVNPYRYVGNGPTNGVDPSGLQWVIPPSHMGAGHLRMAYQPSSFMPLTEQVAKSNLTELARIWKKKGLGYASALLLHFLEKDGGMFLPLAEEKAEVRREAKEVIRHYIAQAVQKRIADRKPLSSDIHYKTHVRWISTDLVIGTGNRLFGSSDVDRVFVNENMFTAFGGADLALTIRVNNVQRLGAGIVFDANVMVEFSDDYTFRPTGSMNMRLAATPYAHARYLETNCGYKPFKHHLIFRESYSSITALGIPVKE